MKVPVVLLPLVFTITVITFLMPGCSKKSENASQTAILAEPPSRNSQHLENAPQPDTNRPLTTYKQVKDNNDLMFTYYALSDKDVDYKRIMNNYSTQYWNTRDQFERHDLEEKARPDIDQEINARRKDRYLKLDIKSTWKLRKYDFDKKGFPQTALSNNTQFGWDKNQWVNSGNIYESYFVKFTNGDDYTVLKVNDEKAARMIEAKLSDELHLIVYGFIKSTDPVQPYLNMQIIKVSLVDANGAQLL